MPTIREAIQSFGRAFKNAPDNLMSGTIQAQGEKHTPKFVRGLGCIGQVLSTATGAVILIESGLKSGAPENAIIPCGVGLGLIFFGSVLPAMKRLIGR